MTGGPRAVESGESSLTRLRRGVQALAASGFAVLFMAVAVTPRGRGVRSGIVLTVMSGYWLLREEIEKHLTGLQEWALFALFGIAGVVFGVIEGTRFTGDFLLSLAAFASVSVFFGYRAGSSR